MTSIEKEAKSVFFTEILANSPEQLDFQDCYIKTTADVWGEQIICANPEMDTDTTPTHKVKRMNGFHWFVVN